jgi:hypothetical protein
MTSSTPPRLMDLNRPLAWQNENVANRRTGLPDRDAESRPLAFRMRLTLALPRLRRYPDDGRENGLEQEGV